MRFVAALDTIIFGVSYLQGAEVDTVGWTRKMLLQFLGNGIIQAAYVTAGSISDRLVFEGDGVSYDVNGEGQVVVTIEPSYAGLSDVDLTGLDDGDVPTWDAGGGVWRPQASGGVSMLLLNNGASVPALTPAGTLIFEKAIAPTVHDFRLGSLPSGWAKTGAPTETFSGAGMATACGAGQAYYFDLGTAPQELTLDLHLLTQTSVTSIMFGPRITSTVGTGVAANWYNSPNALLAAAVTTNAYGSSFTQTGAGPPAYPTVLRIRRQVGAFYASYSSDGGVSWSPETPALAQAATMNRIAFGSIIGSAAATVQKAVYRPGPSTSAAGRARGWWDGAALQPLL